MAYMFFYISAAAVLIIFLVCVYFKPLHLSNIIIGITTVAYTFIYEIIFGDRLHLYYYISPGVSTLYILLSAILLYPLVNIIYTLFLPDNFKAVVKYTLFWITGMLLFEYASVLAKTVVFTGWRPIPWSVVTYFATYIWIYAFYKYMGSKCFKSDVQRI